MMKILISLLSIFSVIALAHGTRYNTGVYGSGLGVYPNQFGTGFGQTSNVVGGFSKNPYGGSGFNKGVVGVGQVGYPGSVGYGVYDSVYGYV